MKNLGNTSSSVTILLSGLMVASLTGCLGGSNGSGGSGSDDSSISAMDISDARAVFIGPSNSVTPASLRAADTTSGERLFKVTEHGYIEEVTVTDESGNTVTTSAAPSAIHEVDDEFLVVAFGSSHYLVRRADGAAIDLGVQPADLWDERIVNRSPFRSDAEGNIYFVSEEHDSEAQFAVQKIANLASSEVTREQATPSTDDVYSFAVDEEGYIAYTGDPQYRVVSPTGELLNLSNEIAAVWRAPNGEIHFNEWNEPQVRRIYVADDGQVSVGQYAELPESGAFHLHYLMHEVDGRLYLIERGDSNDQLVLELYNDDAQLRLVDHLPLERVKAAAATDSHLYLAGTDEDAHPRFVRYEPADDSYVELLDPNAQDVYDVYEISVAESGIVTFGATRMNDSARIVGEIDAQGNLLILNESLDEEITVLVRVN